MNAFQFSADAKLQKVARTGSSYTRIGRQHPLTKIAEPEKATVKRLWTRCSLTSTVVSLGGA
jgi:hypothetical protein